MKTRKNKPSSKLTNTYIKRYTRRKRGGKVIGSGGYGCVFRPALKCKGASKRLSKTISKLMLNKHVKHESSEIDKFLPILKKIPNYKNYFIIENHNVCHPAPLTKSDLNNFELKCKPLIKRNINAKNINNKLDEISSLNLQDGGFDLGKYIYSGLTMDEMKNVNTLMIQLLVNGIIPMNERHVYHADVKESNMVINLRDKHIRLIDWGLSAYTTGKTIPNIMRDKPLQYNLPFSIILFNDTFKIMYSLFILNNPNNINAKSIEDFVKIYMKDWIKERGKGHIKTITAIWQGITGKQNIQDSYIVPYLSAILLEYTRNGKFDLIGYFKNVFLKQIDIWGFIMSYSAFLETGYTNNQINQLILNYLYLTPTEPINVDNLVNDLQNLFLNDSIIQ